MSDATWPKPLRILMERGVGRYDGEAITQREHGLQAAALARAEGASEPLVLAALLHDVGHLLTPGAEDATRRGVDLRHEHVGADALAAWFGPAVSEPVRWHVDAKRLLARAPAYRAALSPESTRSLALQGGPMSDAEAAEFEARPYARDAVRLRGWDDEAKVPDLAVPGPDAYAESARALLQRG